MQVSEIYDLAKQFCHIDPMKDDPTKLAGIIRTVQELTYAERSIFLQHLAGRVSAYRDIATHYLTKGERQN